MKKLKEETQGGNMTVYPVDARTIYSFTVTLGARLDSELYVEYDPRRETLMLQRTDTDDRVYLEITHEELSLLADAMNGLVNRG